jgi:integrase
MLANLTTFKNYLLANGHSSLNHYYNINKILSQLKELDENSINEFIAQKKKEGLSIGTINNYIKSLKAYFKFIKWDIRLPKYSKPIFKIPEFITLEYLEKEIMPYMLELFGKKALRTKVMLYFMFYTGLRKGEVEQLRRKNFNFREKEVKVFIPKTKEERLIPLNKRMSDMLENYFDLEKEEGNAFNLNIGEIERIFNAIQVNFKEVHFHPHIMRGSFAMNLQRNDFSTREIQKLLGHKSIQSTLRYETGDIHLIKEKFNERIK